MKRPVTFLLVASMLASASALADGMSRESAKKISQVVQRRTIAAMTTAAATTTADQWWQPRWQQPWWR